MALIGHTSRGLHEEQEFITLIQKGVESCRLPGAGTPFSER